MKSDQLQRPYDVLIDVMEDIDNVEEMIVVYRRKSEGNKKCSVCWSTHLPSLRDSIGLIEEGKMYMMLYCYSIIGDAD